jgi:hypothetical protein
MPQLQSLPVTTVMASTMTSRFFFLLIVAGLVIRSCGDEIGWITWDVFIIKDGSTPSIIAKDASSDAETLQGAIDLVHANNLQRIKILVMVWIYKYVQCFLIFSTNVVLNRRP